MTLTETRPWNAPKGKATAKAEPKGPTVADTIDRLATIRAQMKPLEKEEKQLSELLKSQLANGAHKGNKVMMNITESPRESFDSKTFKSDHPDFAAKYTAAKPVRTITFEPLL